MNSDLNSIKRLTAMNIAMEDVILNITYFATWVEIKSATYYALRVATWNAMWDAATDSLYEL